MGVTSKVCWSLVIMNRNKKAIDFAVASPSSVQIIVRKCGASIQSFSNGDLFVLILETQCVSVIP